MITKRNLNARQEQFDEAVNDLQAGKGNIDDKLEVASIAVCPTAPETPEEWKDTFPPARASDEQLAVLRKLAEQNEDASRVVEDLESPEASWVPQLKLQAEADDIFSNIAELLAVVREKSRRYAHPVMTPVDEELRDKLENFTEKLAELTCGSREDGTAYMLESDYDFLVRERWGYEASGLDTYDLTAYDELVHNIDSAGFLEAWHEANWDIQWEENSDDDDDVDMCQPCLLEKQHTICVWTA